MKKTIFTLALFLCSVMASQAQFSMDPAHNLKISNETQPNLPHVKVLPNGDMYISYISIEPYEGMEGIYCIFLKLQMLDKAGNVAPGWPEDGMYISQQFTASWCTDYGMEVTSDGSVILAYCDSRDFSEDQSYALFRPYVYKINKEGKHVWNSTGVLVEEDATKTRCFTPMVSLDNSENPIIAWGDGTNDDASSAVFTKLNPETGEPLFDPVAIEGAKFPSVVPSDGDNIIIIYIARNQEYVTAVKYDGQGNRITTGAWADMVLLSEYTALTANPVSGAQSDGVGGVIVCWHGVDYFNYYSMIQRITKDGELTMGNNATRASADFDYCASPQLAVDTINKEAYVLFTRDHESNDMSAYVSKLDYNGQFIFPDSVKLVVGEVAERSTSGLVMTHNGVIGVTGYSTTAYGDETIIAFGMSRDGNIRWGGDTVIVSSMPGRKHDTDISAYVGNQVIAVFRGGDAPIYAQNLINDEDSVSIDPIIVNSNVSFKTYPNPAENQVNIQLNVTSRQNVNIEIFNTQGQKVAVLANNQMQNDNQTYVWKANGMEKGMYFVSVRVGKAQKMSKVILQ